MGPGKNSS